MGNNSIFWVGFSLISCLHSQIMNCKTVENLQGKIFKGMKNPVFANTKLIMSKTLKYKSISFYELNKFRYHYQRETYAETNNAVVRAMLQEKNSKRKNKNNLRDRKQKFLKEFPNFGVSRKGEKRIPMLSCSHLDPKNFFSCDSKWQVCTYDFTFRKVLA